MTEVHSCSYYCDRPECIKAQRDELRSRLESMTDREIMQQVLEALEGWNHVLEPKPDAELISALRSRLAQPVQEPAAHTLNCVCGAVWDIKADGVEEMVHAPNPPQRKPLTPQSPCEMTQAEGRMFKLGWLECEAAHGIKGEA